MLGSSGASPWKQRLELIDSRASIQAFGADVDRESVVSTIFSSQSKGKRDRDQNVVHSLKDREHFQKILERKVLTRPSEEGERLRKNCTKLKLKYRRENWDKRRQDVAFQEINQEFESQRFQPHQASRWLVWRIGIEK